MKKVFLLFAFVAVYGVSMAMSSSNSVSVNNMQTTIVADMNDNNVVTTQGVKEEGVKEKEKAKTTEAKAAKSEGCGTAKSEGCSSTAKSGCCTDKAKSASTEKKEGSK